MSPSMQDLGARVPPHSPEAERAFIGGLIIHGGSKAREVLATCALSPEWLYDSRHRVVFAAAERVLQAGATPDPVTLWGAMTPEEQGACGKFGMLTALLDEVPTVVNIEHYAGIIRGAALLRHLIGAAMELASVAMEYAPADAEVLANDAMKRFGSIVSGMTQARGVAPMTELLTALFLDMEAAASAQDGARVRFGWPNVDQRWGGWVIGTVGVITASTSGGKSTVIRQMALQCATESSQVLVISLEDTPRHWIADAMTTVAGVKSETVKFGPVPAGEWPVITQAATRLAQLPIWFDTRRSVQWSHIRSTIYAAKAREPRIRLVVIDYIQLVRDAATRGAGGGSNRNTELEEIARAGHEIASDLDIAVVFVAQQNRKTADGEGSMPKITNIRDCGAIENVARMIVMPWRPRGGGDNSPIDYGLPGELVTIPPGVNPTVLLFGKVTHGRTGAWPLVWDERTKSLVEIEGVECTRRD